MILAIAVIAALWGQYRVLSLLFDSADILRLRTMLSLAFAFAVLAGAGGPAGLAAAAIAIAACRLHPSMRARPVLPLLLLMLTPAAAVCCAAGVIGDSWTFAPASQFLSWWQAAGPVAFCLAVFPVTLNGRSWRIALFSISVCAILIASAFTSEPAIWTCTIFGGALAFWRAGVWRELGGVLLAAKPIFVLFLAPVLALAANAGAWTQAKDEQLLIARTPVSSRAGAEGALSVQSYSEAGLSNDVTFITTAFQETARASTKIGGSAGLRVALWRDEDWIFSGEASAGVEPFSLTSAGEWTQHAQGDVKLLAGWSGTIEDVPVYAGAEVGWRFRPEEYGDAATLAVSGGIDLAPEVQLNVHAALTIEPSGRDARFAQASLLWRVDDWIGLEAGVQAFSDENGETGAQAVAGVWLRF